MRSVEEWMKMYVHPTGIRLFAARETLKAAQNIGDNVVAGWAQEVIDADTHAQQLELEWLGKKDKNTKVRERAMDVDNQVDRALGALYNHFLSARDRLAPTNPRRKLAEVIIKDVFPKGVYPITVMPFEEEHSAVGGILTQLNQKYPAEIVTLGATIFVENLAEVHTEYGEVLSILNAEPLAFDTVKAARLVGQHLYAGLVVRIIARYFDDEDTRYQLLKTIEDQEERIAERNRRRHSNNAKASDTSSDDPESDDFDGFEDLEDDFEPAADEITTE